MKFEIQIPDPPAGYGLPKMHDGNGTVSGPLVLLWQSEWVEQNYVLNSGTIYCLPEPWTIAAEIKRHEERTGRPLSEVNPLKLSQRDGEPCLLCGDLSRYLPGAQYPLKGYDSGGYQQSWTVNGREVEADVEYDSDIVGPWIK